MMKKCLIFGLIVCGVALNQFALAGTWKDSFEDDIISEWTIFNESPEKEKWWIHEGEAIGETAKGANLVSFWLTGDSKWQNYTMSCRAQITKFNNDATGFGLLLYFRSEELSGYMFRIEHAPDRARILKILPPPQPTVPLGGLDIVVETDKWYQLAATVYENGTLEFQIDQEILRVVDHNPRLKSGQAGLAVGSGQARFDDVEITGANIPNGGPGKSFSVEPRAKLATTWGHLKSY
ncbi:hypothetical protein C6503_25265 [Candidatus Poribacteria bacterium]|nr:MAG: hypothetical protein C6503_25265 [Candidatus Poribacteria bacterium]